MAGENRKFLGRGWGFPPAFDEDGVRMVEAEEDIRESILLLISTIRGERVMRPRYGLGLHAEVFVGMDVSTLTYLKRQIENGIRRFEPRIRLEEVTLDTGESLEGRLLVTLDYVVRSTNSRGNMVIPFYDYEGTNLRAG